MAQLILVARHCAATGPAPDAPLTAEGAADAERLADFLALFGVDRIVASPFRRALQTAAPIARRLGRPVDVEPRLAERVLADGPLDDWRAALRASFDDLDRRWPGGESAREAQARATGALDLVRASGALVPLLITHGNLMTLLLGAIDPRFGYDAWRALTTPDVFAIEGQGPTMTVERVWPG